MQEYGQEPKIEGSVSLGFEPIHEDFPCNFTGCGEADAAVAVLIDGATVVDLHGGRAGAARTPSMNGHATALGLATIAGAGRLLRSAEVPRRALQTAFASQSRGIDAVAPVPGDSAPGFTLGREELCSARIRSRTGLTASLVRLDTQTHSVASASEA